MRRRPPVIPCIFGYVGQKRALIHCYPHPNRGVIVEPFAGSAGYARRWGAGRDVILVEKAPWLAQMWRWLTKASRDEIMSLPLLEKIPREGLSVMDLRPEAKSLIGLKINLTNHPAKVPTKLALMHQHDGQIQWWNEAGRKAVAEAVRWMRHWHIICGDYSAAPDIDATWFVDPPYERLPGMYSARVESYPKLGWWCRSRKGQVIVCEDAAATWLPFRPLDYRNRSTKSSGAGGGSGAVTGQGNTHREGVWTRGC